MKKLVFLNWMMVLLAAGCDTRPCESRLTDSPEIQLELVDMGAAMMACQSVMDVQNLLNNELSFSKVFFDVDQYPKTQIIAERLFRLISDPYIDTLYHEIRVEYGDFSETKQSLENAFANIKRSYPLFAPPKVYIAFSGFYKDLFVSDSLLVIGLDYFLPMDAKYKPHVQQVPEYIQRRYNKKHLVSIIAGFYIGLLTKVDYSENTLIAEMIDYGKSYYFRERVLPCTPDHLIIGFDEKSMNDVKKNVKTIWSHFLSKDLIYETNHTIKTKYIGERPNVPEIGDQCPGRVGRWLGWEIVRAYMLNNPDVTLQQLMSSTRYKKMFLSSGFNPMR